MRPFCRKIGPSQSVHGPRDIIYFPKAFIFLLMETLNSLTFGFVIGQAWGFLCNGYQRNLLLAGDVVVDGFSVIVSRDFIFIIQLMLRALIKVCPNFITF